MVRLLNRGSSGHDWSCLNSSIIGFLFLGLLSVATLLIVWPSKPVEEAIPFDRTVWLENPSSQYGHHARYLMVENLLDEHGLVGMSREEVEELLGPPDTERVNSYHPHPGWDLGPFDPYWESDTTCLSIRFGPDGRVVGIWSPQRGDQGE